VPRRSKRVDSIEKTIGARIADLRKRRAITQVELAQKLGMTQSVLSRYERGVLRLHGALVIEIAKALRASSDEVLNIKEAPSNGNIFKDRRFVRRLQQIEKLSKRKKEALLTTIDAFLRGEQRP
jgi:transcriptional regulator with XRE-family HTH domain